MRADLKRLEEMEKAARAGGGPERVQKQHAQGKLTARERLEVLLDPGSFVELDAFVTHRATEFGLDREHPPGRRRRHRLGGN
jgi:acetyl-CoA carboxylase carboxyltransferase component